MAIELECPVCDAEIPLDGDEKSGELVVCSYCKCTLKLIRKKDRWILDEEVED